MLTCTLCDVPFKFAQKVNPVLDIVMLNQKVTERGTCSCCGNFIIIIIIVVVIIIILSPL